MKNTTYAPTQVTQFNSKTVMFNAQGASAICEPGVTSYIDLKVTDDHLLTGGHLRVKGQSFGDVANIQVLDKDGIMAPAGTVLRQFVTNWGISDDDSMQADFDLPYPAKIYAGLYLRVVYVSTGTTPVKVIFNWNLHLICIQGDP